MDILSVRQKAIKNQFDNSALDLNSCEKVVDRAFGTLLDQLIVFFDTQDGDWHSFEVSDFLNDCRRAIK